MQALKQEYNIIVAIGEKSEIGDGDDLLWNVPADMEYFKETTQGADVIMGRKTYESIPKRFRPLKNRTNIVITKNRNYLAEEGVFIVHSIEDAFSVAENCSDTKKFIIGGGSIYKSTIDRVSKLYVTIIHHSFVGAKTFFPEIKSTIWKETGRKNFPKDNKNEYAYSFVEYVRK